MRAARSEGSAPPSNCWRTVAPPRSSRTRNASPLSVPASSRRTRFGCWRRASVRASAAKRRSCSTSRSTFTATSRSRRTSLPRYTSAMPPRSMRLSMRYRDWRMVWVAIIERLGTCRLDEPPEAVAVPARTSSQALPLLARRAIPTGQRPALAEPVADRPHGLDQPGSLLPELGPKTADVDVDGPCPAVVLVPPDARQELLAGEHLARVGGEEPQELVLHVREVEGSAGHRRLVGLEVEDEVAILDDLGSRRPTRPPMQVPQARLELPRMERREAEIDEHVFAHLELGELRAGDEQEDRLERGVPLAQRTADPECALGVVVGADDCARPPVGRLVLRGDRGVRDGLPRIAGEVERLREQRRRRVREDEERLGDPGHHHSAPRYRSSSHGVTRPREAAPPLPLVRIKWLETRLPG